VKDNLLALAGGLVGGALGYYAFFILAKQGFYALAVPGTLIGLGAGVGKNHTTLVPAICGIGALLLGLYTEFSFAPFVDDDSLGYFVRHLHQLRSMTWIMILIGVGIAFYVPARQTQKV
jgi:hypothetical protein